MSNSAGHTRFPMFSSTIRSVSGKSACSSASVTICASIWHSPPLWICTLSTPVFSAMRLASTSVSISTSIATTLILLFISLISLVRSVVFPLPGEDITLIMNAPFFRSDARSSSATLSLLEKILSLTAITFISIPRANFYNCRKSSPQAYRRPRPSWTIRRKLLHSD